MSDRLLKIVAQPWVIAYWVVDNLLVHPYLWLLGVEYGRDCRFAGLPIVRKVRGARIILGDGVQLTSRSFNNPIGLPHAVILAATKSDAELVIGDGVGISGASIVARQRVKIGARTSIGGGVGIYDNDFHPIDPSHRTAAINDVRPAPVTIGENVFVGTRSVILKGVTIGDGTTVGACSLVTRSLPARVVAAGAPARVLRGFKTPTSA